VASSARMGSYIFLRGRGTVSRGINHSKKSKENSRIEAKRGQENDCNSINHSKDGPSIAMRVGAIFYNYPNDKQTIRKLVRRLKDEGANYRTVQSAIGYLLRRGIIKRVRRGIYKLADRELALMYLERGAPKGPSTPLPGTIPLPTLKYTSPRIKDVFVPRDIFERVINQPPRIDPLLIISPPREGDRARQWQIETEQVKVMIPEKTMKATIYIKGPEWKTNLVDIFGDWIIIGLQGKKWMTEAGINMKELLHFKTIQARVGDIKVSVDRSIFGDDHDLEFSGEVQDVNTAILATLVGPAKFADDISYLKGGLSHLAGELRDMSMGLSMLKHGSGIQELEEKIKDVDGRIVSMESKLEVINRKLEVLAGGIVKVIDQTSPPDMGGGEFSGYA